VYLCQINKLYRPLILLHLDHALDQPHHHLPHHFLVSILTLRVMLAFLLTLLQQIRAASVLLILLPSYNNVSHCFVQEGTLVVSSSHTNLLALKQELILCLGLTSVVFAMVMARLVLPFTTTQCVLELETLTLQVLTEAVTIFKEIVTSYSQLSGPALQQTLQLAIKHLSLTLHLFLLRFLVLKSRLGKSRVDLLSLVQLAWRFELDQLRLSLELQLLILLLMVYLFHVSPIALMEVF